jgi:hypothetical protein
VNVNRRTFTTKRGKLVEAAELLAQAQSIASEQTIRITPAEFGSFDTVAVEFDFESLAAYEAFWGGLADRPGAAEVLTKWGELVEIGGSNELWEVYEAG